jgi:hypothetical protein
MTLIKKVYLNNRQLGNVGILHLKNSDQRGSEPPLGQKCYICGNPGHKLVDCEVHPSCERCGSLNHFMRRCTERHPSEFVAQFIGSTSEG